ncbi:protein argonaute 2-like [Mercurialis annua]|uniref:protein argonaute 2-like n=1 Tax=Mercurialis annua TaxID=3986 RepID=UPI00215FAA5D|nr:protein argonaute 2-like [Mercurialis annua]
MERGGYRAKGAVGGGGGGGRGGQRGGRGGNGSGNGNHQQQHDHQSHRHRPPPQQQNHHDYQQPQQNFRPNHQDYQQTWRPSNQTSSYNQNDRDTDSWVEAKTRGGNNGGGGGRGGSIPPRGGGGRGPPRGRGGLTSTPTPPPPSSASSNTVPDPTKKLQKKSENVASCSNSNDTSNRFVPVKRPDKGGTLAIRTATLHVNHFPVKFNPDSVIIHYDIDVKPDVTPKGGRVSKVSKFNLASIRNKLFKDNPSEFPLSMTAYDGEKNIFSAVPLPTGKFKVDFSEGEDTRTRTYTFSIKFVSELKLCKLKEYLSGKLMSIPRDILQGMDVVMKENPARHMVSVGRSFHPADAHEEDSLGYGITASRGFQHSLKPTFQGLAMCLDYSVLAFRKRLPVIDFLMEYIPGFNLNDFKSYRRHVENALKGLKVTVTHRITKQKYIVAGLTKDNTRKLSFLAEDPDGKAPPTQVTLVEYFRQKYKDIKYKDIPCLDLGKNKRRNYVPMEFCVLVEGQIYPKEDLDRDAALFLKDMSLASPRDRQRIICDMVRSRDGPTGGDIVKNFGMDVDMKMTSVVSRVIGPPELKLRAPNGRVIKIAVDKEKGHWNLVGKGVVEGKAIERWAVLDFTSSDRGHSRLMPEQFISKLRARCGSLGMPMKEPLFCHPTTMHKFSNIDVLHDLLEVVTDRAYQTGKGRLQILICVMSRKDPGYKYLKWISETRVGIVTQCCLSICANKGNDQYFANVALKINAKLGGSNVELIDRLPYFESEGHVMFIGADVNHPASRNTTSPSIAALVGTVNWPAANRYAARVRPQDHRKEKILNFGDMCLELVETYARMNKVRPGNIVIFRDGVSEGQFDMVLNEELIDLKRAFQSISYAPTVTLIVAQKRHQTRLFPASRNDGSHNGNVSPGTVVDTTIVHPFEFDFYLCSHYGSLGTSKPTHYHVLWDEHGFSSDELQRIIYNMCYTFARCTKPVSLVPPVYYADLVAYRGRLYYESLMDGQSPASGASSSSSLTSSSLSSTVSLDDRFYKLHADLENIMFFI